MNRGGPTRPSATRNTPLNTKLDLQELIRQSPITEIDWEASGVYDGTDDGRFYDPTTPKGKDKKFTMEKFDGEDNTTWYTFASFIETYILRRTDLTFSEKQQKLRHNVSGKAKACCEVSNDRLGFLTALRILEKKYGGQNNMERALYKKLRNLGLLSTKDLNTVVEAKITIWSLVRLYTADNRDSNKLDEIFPLPPSPPTICNIN
jgi:hypothetical protein